MANTELQQELTFITIGRAFPDLSICDANKNLILSFLQEEGLDLTVDNASVAVTSLGNQLVQKPKERTPKPEAVVEEDEQAMLRRLKRELHSGDAQLAAKVKKQLLEIVKRGSLAAPQLPPIPEEITADDIRVMGRVRLEQLYMRHGSQAVKNRLNNRG